MRATTHEGAAMPGHEAFRAAVETDDWAGVEDCLHEDVTFSSPAVHEQYRGRDAVMVVLRAVGRVLEDFAYAGTFVGGDGREVLEFRARVGDRRVQGIDLLTFDEDSGLVTDLTVMVRPLRGLEALVAAMGRELGVAADG
jgi:hypothetical protein